MKRIMTQCSTPVMRDAVSRDIIDGIEHIMIKSHTLPFDIVMNGGLYPAKEIELGFSSLERSLAPIEHPTNSGGEFISASDPEAINKFYAGAYVENVRVENERIAHDFIINVQEALKSDRGRRLLDRINELETSKDPRPVHTSVGVFISVEETDGVKTNDHGQEFTWIAHDLFFDHNAILLDSVGAAQPDQGVGMAVNSKGEKCAVDVFTLNADDVAKRPNNDGNRPEPKDMRSNDDHGMSMSELHEAVREGLERASIAFGWIEELFSESVIFSSASFEEFFTVPFTIDETTSRVTIVGIPLPVERNVTFTPKVNSEEGDAMKDLMLKALADAGITVNAEISDDDLLAQYNELQANQSEGDGDGAGDDTAAALAEVVANALKPVTEELAGLKAQLNATADKDKADLVALIANSDKYPAIDEDTAKLLPIEKLREMSANCGNAHGIPLHTNVGDDDKNSIATEMPE